LAGPYFISEQAILDLHDDLLDTYGGPAGFDYAKVCSVAAYPQQKFYYDRPRPTIPQLGAAYAFAAARFHAFTDGNKRIALALMDLFLMQNGYWLVSSSDENVEIMLALAKNEICEEDFVGWVEANSDEYSI
jgi:death-on-curing protein